MRDDTHVPFASMTTPLTIIGAGGHGAEVIAYALDQGIMLLGAIDDGKPAGPWQGTQELGGLADLASICAAHDQVHYLTAFDSNALRFESTQHREGTFQNTPGKPSPRGVATTT